MPPYFYSHKITQPQIFLCCDWLLEYSINYWCFVVIFRFQNKQMSWKVKQPWIIIKFDSKAYPRHFLDRSIWSLVEAIGTKETTGVEKDVKTMSASWSLQISHCWLNNFSWCQTWQKNSRTVDFCGSFWWKFCLKYVII